MTIVTQSQPEPAPLPFFEDTRTLYEKLTADDREWRPTQPEYNCPSMVFGLVLELGSYCSKFGRSHHTARLLTDENVVWSVIALHGFLGFEFERKQPRVGDFVAIGFMGTRPAAKEGESDPYVYRLEVERNPSRPLLVGVNDMGNESLSDDDPPRIPIVDGEPPPQTPAVENEPIIETQKRERGLGGQTSEIPF